MRVRICVSIAISILMFSPYCFSAATFQGYGNYGILSSEATAISADGSVVVGNYTTTSGGSYGFAWNLINHSRTQLVDFSANGGNYSCAYGVSGDGSIIVGKAKYDKYAATTSTAACFWNAAGGGRVLRTSGTPSEVPFLSWANAVSDDSSTIVGFASYNYSMSTAFKAQSNSMYGIKSVYANNSSVTPIQANAVSNNGDVIVGYGSSASGAEAFKFVTDGTISGNMVIGLGDLPGGEYASNAYAVSADGSVIVGESVSSSGNEAFIWTETTGMTGLGDLPGGIFTSRANDVSADGSIVVGVANTELGTEGFYWTSALGMQSITDLLISYGLDLTGWTLTSCTAVSGDGMTIVGNGTNPQGNREAWIATIPEPTTILLLGLGGMVLRKFKI